MAKVQVDIKKLIGMLLVGGIVLFGLKLRGDGKKVNDIDPDILKKGQVLCIIESMKIMNEIECEQNGIIKKILVKNSDPVEFNQPLFIID